MQPSTGYPSPTRPLPATSTFTISSGYSLQSVEPLWGSSTNPLAFLSAINKHLSVVRILSNIILFIYKHQEFTQSLFLWTSHFQMYDYYIESTLSAGYCTVRFIIRLAVTKLSLVISHWTLYRCFLATNYMLEMNNFKSSYHIKRNSVVC